MPTCDTARARRLRAMAGLIALTRLVGLGAHVDDAAGPTYFTSPDGVRIPTKGWLSPLPPGDESLAGQRCNIDRRPYLTRSEFQRKYRDRAPVILGGSPEERLNLTGQELASYFGTWGDLPMALYHPVGRPGVGGHVMSLGEYVATFQSVPEANVSHMDAAAETSYHCNSQSLDYHKELVTALFGFRNTSTFVAESGVSSRTPRAVPAALCRLHATVTGSCTCRPNLFVAGASGAGLPWHWHQEVTGNMQLWGRKRWFVSPNVPPLGYNHRDTNLRWFREVYTQLPAQVFESTRTADGVLIPPQMYECTLQPGELMYLPHGWYHSTMDVGHSLNVGYTDCDKEYAEDSQRTDAERARLRHNMKAWEWKRPEVVLQSQRVSANASLALAEVHHSNAKARASYVDADPGDATVAFATIKLPAHSAAEGVTRKYRGSFHASGQGKGMYMASLPVADNGASMSASNIPAMAAELLNGLSHAVNMYPDEPEFMYHVSRGLIRDSRKALKDIRWADLQPEEVDDLEDAIAARQEGGRVVAPPKVAELPRPGEDPLEAYRRKLAAAKLKKDVQSHVAEVTKPEDLRAQVDAQHRTLLPVALRPARRAADYLEVIAQLNPLFPDAFAMLAYAYDALSTNHPNSRYGPHGRVDRTLHGGGRYLDRALAAAKRAAALEPRSPAVCNHIAGLLARGATEHAVLVNDDGVFHLKDAAHQSEPQHATSAATSLANALSRQTELHRHLLHCLRLAGDVLETAYSRDAVLAATQELVRTSEALRDLAGRRKDIFWNGALLARSQLSQESDDTSETAVAVKGAHSPSAARVLSNASTVLQFMLPHDNKATGSEIAALQAPTLQELYHRVSVEFRTRKRLSIDDTPQFMGSPGGEPIGASMPKGHTNSRAKLPSQRSTKHGEGPDEIDVSALNGATYGQIPR